MNAVTDDPTPNTWILAVDIQDVARRDNHAVDELRHVLHDAVRTGLERSTAEPGAARIADLGDGLLAAIPVSQADPAGLLIQFPRLLAAALSLHNRRSTPGRRLRVRLAVDIARADDGGADVVALARRAFRVTDAADVRNALAAAPDEPLVVAVTDEALRTTGIDETLMDGFTLVRVAAKDADLHAWIRIPAHSRPRPRSGKPQQPEHARDRITPPDDSEPYSADASPPPGPDFPTDR